MPEVKYKLKAEASYATLEFEGPSVLASALRHAVVSRKLNGNAGAMGLTLTNAITGQGTPPELHAAAALDDGCPRSAEYVEDDALVPADAMILVKRVPLSRMSGAPPAPAKCAQGSPSCQICPSLRVQASSVDKSCSVEFGLHLQFGDPRLQGDPRLRGAAAPGTAGQGAISEGGGEAGQDTASGAGFVIADEDEAAKIQNMMAQAGAEWNQRSIIGGGRQGKGKGFGKGGGSSGKGGGGTGPTPPPGYICFRCGQTGHYIQYCPTNGDPKYDLANKRRMPVGIPRDRLEVVASGEGDEGEKVSGFKLADGSIARMVADEQQFAKATRESGAKVDDASVPAELRCPMTHRLFHNAVLLPCCGSSVSDDAVAITLVYKEGEAEGDEGATCVLCGTTGVAVDEVIPNRQLRDAVEAYLEDVKGNAAASRACNGSGGRGGGQKGGEGRGVVGGAKMSEEEILRQRTFAAMRSGPGGRGAGGGGRAAAPAGADRTGVGGVGEGSLGGRSNLEHGMGGNSARCITMGGGGEYPGQGCNRGYGFGGSMASCCGGVYGDGVYGGSGCQGRCCGPGCAGCGGGYGGCGGGCGGCGMCGAGCGGCGGGFSSCGCVNGGYGGCGGACCGCGGVCGGCGGGCGGCVRGVYGSCPGGDWYGCDCGGCGYSQGSNFGGMYDNCGGDMSFNQMGGGGWSEGGQRYGGEGGQYSNAAADWGCGGHRESMGHGTQPCRKAMVHAANEAQRPAERVGVDRQGEGVVARGREWQGEPFRAKAGERQEERVGTRGGEQQKEGLSHQSKPSSASASRPGEEVPKPAITQAQVHASPITALSAPTACSDEESDDDAWNGRAEESDDEAPPTAAQLGALPAQPGHRACFNRAQEGHMERDYRSQGKPHSRPAGHEEAPAQLDQEARRRPAERTEEEDDVE
ncbi:MAG: hypothetical protein SGPRY_002162, partial [Prymnesium sp.]